METSHTTLSKEHVWYHDILRYKLRNADTYMYSKIGMVGQNIWKFPPKYAKYIAVYKIQVISKMEEDLMGDLFQHPASMTYIA